MTAEPASIGRFLSILHRYWQVHLDRELRPFGIGAAHIPILMFLYRRDGVTQADVVRHLRTDKGATARTIRKLVDQGYIVREPHPDDGRAYHICLTTKARTAKTALREALRGWTDAVSQDFGDADRAELVRLLQLMVERADALVRPACNRPTPSEEAVE